MSIILDLRTTQRGKWTVLADGMPNVCGWCGLRFLSAHELVKHIKAEREALE